MMIDFGVSADEGNGRVQWFCRSKRPCMGPRFIAITASLSGIELSI